MIEAGGDATPSAHDLIERLRRLLAGALGVLVAYLYGSPARSRAGPLSDVDVALLLDGDDEERRLELTAAIAHAVAPARADVVVLNDAPSALSYRVLRDGTVLASRDERARVQHWVRTVDRYLDMAPAGLRNVLVHAYLDVDPARIWTYLGRLGDLEDLAQAVDACLKRAE